jgi:hypothetical protein
MMQINSVKVLAALSQASLQSGIRSENAELDEDTSFGGHRHDLVWESMLPIWISAAMNGQY